MLLVAQLVVLAIVAVVQPVFALPTTIGNGIFDTTVEPAAECHTPACVLAAENIREFMDATADPCDDFYDYACGRFLKDVPIPSKDVMLLPSITDTLAKVKSELLSLIQEPIAPNDAHPIAMAKQYFADCMDEEAREAIGSRPLLELIDQIGGWPLLTMLASERQPIGKWWQLTAKFAAAGVNADLLVNVLVEDDLRQLNRRVIYLSPPPFSSLPELRKLVDNTAPHLVYVLEVAKQLGAASGTQLDTDAHSLYELIGHLSAIQVQLNELRPMELYNPYVLADLQQLHTYVNWTDYINAQLPPGVRVTDADRVIVVSSMYLEGLGRVLAATDDRVVANFMVWKVVQRLIPYAHKKLIDLLNNYTASVLGNVAHEANAVMCLESTKLNIPIVLDAMYVRRHFDVAARDAVSGMVNGVRQLMAENLWSDVEWMDAVTKRRAVLKLDAIEQVVGYPEQLLDDAALEAEFVGVNLRNLSFFAAARRLKQWSRTTELAKLHRPRDRVRDWSEFSMSSEVNAFFSPNQNIIVIPAAVLQGRLFAVDRPNYINFASIGTIIGHELNHGFDSSGRQFDERGNLTDWWEPETAQHYHERATCLHDQYSKFVEASTRQPLNANLTQAEDISDNGGVHLLYKTYRQWVAQQNAEQPEPQLPGLDMTPNQLFWMAYAQQWCGKTRHEYAVYSREMDPHSPFRFRVLGPLTNSKSFAEDFGCPVGSPMNPETKCSLW